MDMDLNTVFVAKRKPELEKDALELGMPRRTRSMWNGRGSVNPLPGMELPDMASRNESQSVHQQRNSNLSRLFAACNTASNPGRPKNAADLATSLVKLVIPYDLMNTQRSLAKVQDRLKAIETNAQKSDAARGRIEHGLEIVASEIDTLRRLYDQLAPSSRHDPPVDINAKIQKIGSEMLAKASANDNNLNQALQMVQTALAELSDERAKLQLAAHGLPARKQSLEHDFNEDDVSTASEDVVDEKSGALQARASVVLKRDEPGTTRCCQVLQAILTDSQRNHNHPLTERIDSTKPRLDLASTASLRPHKGSAVPNQRNRETKSIFASTSVLRSSPIH